MRVAFSDPQGARLWRMLPYAGPVALFLFACFAPFLTGVNAALTAVLAVVLHCGLGLVHFGVAACGWQSS